MQQLYFVPRNRLFIIAVTLLFLQVKSSAQTADIVLTNGKIFTADSKQPYVQALAIKGNKILATGNNARIEKLVSLKTKKIDLRGKTVVPGFNDAHDHLGFNSSVGIGFGAMEMSVEGPSKTAVLDSLSRLVKMARQDQWISGLIGTRVLLEKDMRNMLDSIAPHNPVVLQIWWGHGQIVNKKALEAAGISDDDKDPSGGWYKKDPSTKKITIIYENAQAPVWNAWLSSDYEGQIKGMQAYSQKQLKAGVTTVQQMSSPLNYSESIRFFKAANLSQRIRIIAWPRSTTPSRQLTEWDVSNNQPTPLTYISGIKYMLDGTPFEQSALAKKPYNKEGTWYGRLDYPVDTIKQILKEALSSNRQLMLHIVGDSTIGVVLSLMKQMAGDDVWKKKRVRFEHNELYASATESELNRLKQMGVLVMHTPQYNHKSRIRSLMEKGIIVGISPDGTTNPFADIMRITMQQTNPGENITREQAVIAYTKTNAYAEFKEKDKGILTKGMLADIAVLSQDIFTIPANQLPATQSVLTIVDGKIAFQNAKIP